MPLKAEEKVEEYDVRHEPSKHTYHGESADIPPCIRDHHAWRYFEVLDEHYEKGVENQPIKAVLHHLDTSGWVAKWALQLFEFDIKFHPRPSIKAQVLMDFVLKCTIPDEEKLKAAKGSSVVLEEQINMDLDPEDQWILHVDGSFNSSESGAGIILTGSEGDVVEYALRFEFPATNNKVEYEALIAGLRLTKDVRAKHLKVFSDSQLIMRQVKDEYEAQEKNIKRYLEKVPQMQNTRMDALSKLAASIPPEFQIGTYIEAALYVLHDDKLYKWSFSLPLLRCLQLSETDYTLGEVYEGIYGNHLGMKTLSYKIFRQGYYEPSMQKDASNFVKRYDRCQRISNVQHQLVVSLAPITAPWPFAQWRIDILDLFPQASDQLKFFLVAIDYFMKWVEAEPLAHITEVKANGEAEVMNRTILQDLRVRLNRTGRSWMDELYHVMWAYRIFQRISTGETPFNLAFETEAIIPVEIGLPSLRIEEYNEDTNSEWL
ncbi:uncharacterized protein [Elaeis guineensis]|uniref:uncharacterized protein n=1 Tax=Elaeis guineensis var. tenera TaxID=51953 RepID=UPI003C6D9681